MLNGDLQLSDYQQIGIRNGKEIVCTSYSPHTQERLFVQPRLFQNHSNRRPTLPHLICTQLLLAQVSIHPKDLQERPSADCTSQMHAQATTYRPIRRICPMMPFSIVACAV